MNVKEYKRTCANCGKVWHSLASRETALKLSQTSDFLGQCGSSMQSCGTCGMCGGAERAQHSRNFGANNSELNRLHTCPDCGSAVYKEEVIEY